MSVVTNCHTCELVVRRDQGQAPLWDCIQRTAYWDVAHSFNTSILGWMVLVTRRHIAAIHEMSEAEGIELGVLIRRVSIILEELTGCMKTYVVQFAESPNHPHVHVHIIPRMADQPDELRGPNIFRAAHVPDEVRVTEEKMNEFCEKVQARLLNM
ncbi:MAG: HIT family protein [Chloroflexota bacterium]